MPARRRKRLDPAAFHLPVDEIRAGVYSEPHLLRSRELTALEVEPPRVTMHVACSTAAILGGIDEVIAILRLCTEDWGSLAVHALFEGERIDAWTPVLTVEGAYDAFAYLETLIIGVLCRRTCITTRTRALVDAARPKTVFFHSARHDHWRVQAGDGQAVIAGGARGGSTEAQGRASGTVAEGLVPHTLIAAHAGDTAAAARRFAARLDPDVPILAPVDYENDCVRTSLEVARALEARLWGVRLDTPEHLVDASIIPQMGTFNPTGVNPRLVWNVRNALDAEGFGDVKIVVAGAVTLERIRAFEDEGVPVDAYSVGDTVLAGRFEFVADIVERNGEPVARAGRETRPNPRLEKVK
ncbi:MAG: quinolinate phosphoribosyl transferase [Gemmatimonadaceae bacterium]